MDKPVNNKTGRSKSAATNRRPSRAEAEDAVRTLIRWAGDDPEREGLLALPHIPPQFLPAWKRCDWARL